MELRLDFGGSWFCYGLSKSKGLHVKDKRNNYIKEFGVFALSLVSLRARYSNTWGVIYISLVFVIVCFCISPLYIVRQILGSSHAFWRGLFSTRDGINTLFMELDLIATLLPNQVSQIPVLWAILNVIFAWRLWLDL